MSGYLDSGIDFVGAGWAYPLGVDATGRIALVARDREIQESLRLILGTVPCERPMRPEFGCRIHEHVFGPADASTASQAAHDVREAIERWLKDNKKSPMTNLELASKSVFPNNILNN